MTVDKALNLLIESVVTGGDPLHGNIATAMRKFNDAGNNGRYEAVHQFNSTASHDEVVNALRAHVTKSGEYHKIHPNERLIPDTGMTHSTEFHGSGEVPTAFSVDSDAEGNHHVWARENHD